MEDVVLLGGLSLSNTGHFEQCVHTNTQALHSMLHKALLRESLYIGASQGAKGAGVYLLETRNRAHPLSKTIRQRRGSALRKATISLVDTLLQDNTASWRWRLLEKAVFLVRGWSTTLMESETMTSGNCDGCWFQLYDHTL